MTREELGRATMDADHAGKVEGVHYNERMCRIGEALYALGVAAERERVLTMLVDFGRQFDARRQHQLGLVRLIGEIRCGS